MKIAVDAMGGDFAPAATVEGAYRAVTEDEVQIVLVGDEVRIHREMARLGGSLAGLEVHHAEEAVAMDESAITPLRRKRRSSIRLCAELVRDGAAQAMVSAGNTGAALVSAKAIIGTIAGVDRPALAAIFPNATGRTVLLDVGANVDSKLAHLRQFAVMGDSYARVALGLPSPRIGLLSIGEEESKGTDFTRQVFRVLEATGLNFAGNVEGNDLFEGSVDVVVCDGFVGNVVLKSAEALAGLLTGLVREEIDASLRTRVGGLLARPAFERIRRRTDYREYGAAPLLGIDGGCFIGHGRSDARAVQTSIHRAVEFLSADLHHEIADHVATLHKKEERLLGRQEATI